MNRIRFHSASLARINIRAASLLVPRRDRADWMAEWTAELYHLCHAPRGAFDSPHADPIEFSFGAYRDAFWIRCNRLRADALLILQPMLQPGSAARCLLALAGGALAGLLLCFVLPGARSALMPAPYRSDGNLVLISASGHSGTLSPSIRWADYREWTSDTSSLFTQLAFYRTTVKSLHLSHHRAGRIAIAQASENFLEVLNLRAQPETSAATLRSPRLFLTHAAWRTWYGGDPHLVGHTADIDGTPVLIAGVLPNDAWRLPGRIDALLVDDEQSLQQLSPNTKGFVIARIRDSAFPPPRAGYRSMFETRRGVTLYFDCVSVNHLLWQPLFNFLCAMLLACLIVPATTPLPLGDYPVRRGRLPVATRARRWTFLAAKISLVLPLVLLCSTAGAYGPAWLNPSTSLLIQFTTILPTLLFGFRWILQDQRRRCPECLRLLSNPARVGQASCNFLSWNGTELFCDRGHGLLHIPELATSWFSTQRWLCLDSSWLCLFPETRSPSPGMV